MAELREQMTVPQHIAKKAFSTKWAVYAKRPFAAPRTVVEYLGRYAHRIAMSNHRLTDVNDRTVSFSYKDYRHGRRWPQKNSISTLRCDRIAKREF